VHGRSMLLSTTTLVGQGSETRNPRAIRTPINLGRGRCERIVAHT